MNSQNETATQIGPLTVGKSDEHAGMGSGALQGRDGVLSPAMKRSGGNPYVQLYCMGEVFNAPGDRAWG